MSVLQTVKSALPIDDESEVTFAYECRDCGHEFESEKAPGRAVCVECRSADVTHLE